MTRAFRLDPVLTRFVPPVVAQLIAPPLEAALALRKLDRLYQSLPADLGPAGFCAAALARIGARFDVCGAVETLPRSGPLVICANHPFGGLDGLFLYDLLATLRPDVRILGNALLSRIEPLAPAILPVDILSGTAAAVRNGRMLRRAERHVAEGGALLLFPAGEVSSVQAPWHGITDPPWHPFLGHLVRTTGARTVPIHVGGHNSAFFQAAGLVNPRLRTALLPRELMNKRRGRPIPVCVGAALPAATVVAAGDDRAVTTALRSHTYALGAPAARVRPRRKAAPAVAVAAAIEPELLAAEVAALPAEACLARSGELEAWIAPAARIPLLMQEIGRARELTFRGVGEGTGRARDVDLYDNLYDQLFLWHPATATVAGGYRIGRLDRLQATAATRGAYTQTLFRFQRPFYPSLGNALELGRSFVQPQFQRSYTPLLLLWKGIAQFLVRHPQYRTLFGPVSISNDYTPAAQAAITGYLAARHGDPLRAAWVRGRKPLPRGGAARRARLEAGRLGDIETLDRLVGALEGGQRGVPVLLRQYLKLGAQVAGFNVDAAFGHSIDALVVVDMDALDERTLARYMGADGAAHYQRCR